MKILIAPIKAPCRKESENEDIREQSVSPFSTIVCKEAETRAEGNARRRRSKEEERDEGSIGCHPEIAEVNFDGRPAQRGGGLVRRALSRAHERSRKAANEDEAREAGSPREKDGLKRDIEAFGGFQGDGEARWQVRVIGDDR